MSPRAARGGEGRSTRKCGQIYDDRKRFRGGFRAPLIGTYKLLILGHYLSQSAFFQMAVASLHSQQLHAWPTGPCAAWTTQLPGRLCHL